MSRLNAVPADHVIRFFDSPSQVPASQWNELLHQQDQPAPFMRHEYLTAMHDSGSASPATGWTPTFLTVWRGTQLQAGCVCYLKDHSYGEYVFDWAWANAYEQHGLAYYPKGLVAAPFTPVPGARLLATDDAARRVLLSAVIDFCRQRALSSLHLLFLTDQEAQCCEEAGLMLRHTVQFHWANQDWQDFDGFLASLAQDKRKKIRQERRKVADAGVVFEARLGLDIRSADWDFFYRCYERTYLEHGNAPYLNRDFFSRMAQSMPQHWLLFIAQRAGRPIACSLIGLAPDTRVAYGRYWGALERVDCLHFEACYYQPLAWCIANGYASFEGGAQGEHKMARALLPTRTTSAHWLAHPAFADAVQRFLEREDQGVDNYLKHLDERTPFRQEP